MASNNSSDNNQNLRVNKSNERIYITPQSGFDLVNFDNIKESANEKFNRQLSLVLDIIKKLKIANETGLVHTYSIVDDKGRVEIYTIYEIATIISNKISKREDF